MADAEQIEDLANKVRLSMDVLGEAIEKLIEAAMPSQKPSETEMMGFASAEEARRHRMARGFGARLEEELG